MTVGNGDSKGRVNTNRLLIIGVAIADLTAKWKASPRYGHVNALYCERNGTDSMLLLNLL